MEKTTKQLQQECIEKLRQRLNELIEKLNATGYVVAGYGGDTYYCFVGAGRGFNGAALSPISRHPKIFDTYKEAECEAYNNIYMNGRNEVIELEVIKAGAYYRRIHTMIERNLEDLKELF